MSTIDERAELAALLGHAQTNRERLAGDHLVALAAAMVAMSTDMRLNVSTLNVTQVRELRRLVDAVANDNGQVWTSQ
ncbi:hypothetical protein [Mycobacterium paragordonae]|uniref:hypothetical protein n=1 Tax=Mycobacterium paragordonae TaxID=1389713 RepID=UPI0012E2379C|nr:hypothetical protein [Mycobacterium paragordonae]